jgi:transmembrane sensor
MVDFLQGNGKTTAQTSYRLDRMQKEVADQRVASGSSISHESRLKTGTLSRSIRLLSNSRAVAKRTMTRATDIEQQASEWLIRSESGNFTTTMQSELERWLQDPSHRVSFLRVKEAWRRASRLRTARPFDGNVDADFLKEPGPTARRNGNNPGSPSAFRIATTAAAALVVYLVGFAAWIAFGPTEWISYTTAIGGYEHVTLADGSVIQLNTNSEIEARITRDRREIKLVRGEVLIKATNDPHSPLTVSAGNANARTGLSPDGETAFVVRLRPPGRVDFGVTDGIITVGSSYRLIDVALRRSLSLESTLVAGDIATVRSGNVSFERVGLDELNRKLSWTAGLLSFQGETLTQVADEFNRYNRRQLLVTDPTIAARRIGGAFQATDPDSFVAALEKRFDIHGDEQFPSASGDTIIRLRGLQRR